MGALALVAFLAITAAIIALAPYVAVMAIVSVIWLLLPKEKAGE